MLALLPMLNVAKTLFLKYRVRIALALGALLVLLGLMVGSYQLGKMRAQHECSLEKVRHELEQEQKESQFLLDLQKENRQYYRDQMSFNRSFMNELEKTENKVVYKVDTIYKETPVVQVYDPCGNASIDYSIVRMRNEAGLADSNSN